MIYLRSMHLTLQVERCNHRLDIGQSTANETCKCFSGSSCIYCLYTTIDQDFVYWFYSRIELQSSAWYRDRDGEHTVDQSFRLNYFISARTCSMESRAHSSLDIDNFFSAIFFFKYRAERTEDHKQFWLIEMHEIVYHYGVQIILLLLLRNSYVVNAFFFLCIFCLS